MTLKTQLLGTSLLAALISSPLGAQTAPTEDNPNAGRWYQVEIIVFTQRAPEGDNEIWPTFPNLDYGLPAAQLTMADEGVMASTELANDTSSGPLPPSQQAVIWPKIDLTTGQEVPFVELPETLLTLKESAQAIDASAGRRVLLHTGWNMPVYGEQDRTSLRLQGGERYGTHPELDGFIHFHIGRFLHVETDLYHSRYVLTDEPLGAFFSESTPALRPQYSTHENWQGFTDWQPTIDSNNADRFTLRRPTYYVPEESVHLAERRRMPSNEIHYLDSPRLGLVIQFTPYTPVEIFTLNPDITVPGP